MSRLFTIFFLFHLGGFDVFSQKQTEPIKVLNSEIVLNGNVSATEYVFPKNIFWSYYDTTKNLLTVLTRLVNKGEYAYKNNGELLVYDLSMNEIKWQMPFDFKTMSVSQTDSFLLVEKNYIKQLVNTSSGFTKKLVTSYNLRLINNEYKIGLFECCYDQDSNSLMLMGINLESGKEIWRKKVYAKYGWNEIIKQNDSTYIFNLDGIRSINILNGKGWYYSGIVGDESYKTANIANAIATMVGLMTGMFVYTIGADIAYGIHSNIYIGENSIFFAAKNKMYCLDNKGYVKWEKDLPLDKMSRSLVFINDSILHLVNLGIAFFNKNTVRYGEPFFAKYDSSNGNEIILDDIEVKKTKQKELNYFYSYQDSFLIVRSHEVAKHSYSNALPIKSVELEKKSKENMVKVIDNKLNYTKVNGEFKSFYELDSSKFNILTDSAKIFQFDSELNLVRHYEKGDVYKLFYVYKDVRLLLSGDNMAIVSNQGELISEIEISYPLEVKSNYLLSVYRHKLTKYDLDKMVK